MMKNHVKNIFLDRVCTRLREDRPLGTNATNYTFRVEQIAGVPFVSLWFRTRGCRHDHSGGCTMCNYGISSPVSADEMIEYVSAGLSMGPDDENMIILVSPSGSMFDEWEVPSSAREGILRLVNNNPGRVYLCESRAETITERKIQQYAEILSTKTPCVEIGLESADSWIMRYCVNKKLSPDIFLRSIEILHKYRVRAIANVLVGTPFLSPKEMIDDAVRTIRWAISNGVDNCVVFPVHVKQWTLVEWLWKHGYYSPPSLWSLVEVLAHLGSDHARKTTISWYKIYSEKVAWGELNPATEWAYLASPTTCQLCQSTVMKLLDEYRDTNDFEVIRQMMGMECECKDTWRTTLETPVHQPLRERVALIYEAVSREVLGSNWWDMYGEGVLCQLDLT